MACLKIVIFAAFTIDSIMTCNLNYYSVSNKNSQLDIAVVTIQNNYDDSMNCVHCSMYHLVVFCCVKSHDDMKLEPECQNLDSEFGFFGCREEQKTTPDRPGWKMFFDGDSV